MGWKGKQDSSSYEEIVERVENTRRSMPSWTTILHPDFQICFSFFFSLDWRCLQRVVETLMKCSVRGQTSSSLAYTSNVTHAVLTGVWMGAEARFLAQKEPKLRG